MPDLLTTSEGSVLMAANVSRGHPWHRLGRQVTNDMTMEEALAVSGSDDVVSPTTLYTMEHTERFLYHTDGHTYVRLDQLEEVDDYQAAKSDKYGTLGIHSPGFNIKQRREILEFAYDIVGLDPDGVHIDTIGNDPSWKMFFAYIRVPDLVIDPNGIADTIERGLYAATSFNGTLPNLIGYSNIRVACYNALQTVLKGAQQVIRAKHTRNADERMREAAIALEYVGAIEKQMVENAERMLRVDGDKALDSILDHFYPISGELSDLAKTRRTRERGDVRLLYQGQGNTNVDKVGRNGWAAYNAFTEYIDHASGVKVGKQVDKAGVQRATRAVMPGVFVDKKIAASRVVLEAAA
jgi:phage/plasmid-like protein (TIGR03299 family)